MSGSDSDDIGNEEHALIDKLMQHPPRNDVVERRTAGVKHPWVRRTPPSVDKPTTTGKAMTTGKTGAAMTLG